MENVLIEISNLNKHCDELYKQYVEHKSRHCDKYWLDKYKKNFDDAILIKQKLEKMASIIKDKTIWGVTYFIPVKTLDEYFELYELLESIPESELKIYSPKCISIWKKSYDFCQVE